MNKIGSYNACKDCFYRTSDNYCTNEDCGYQEGKIVILNDKCDLITHDDTNDWEYFVNDCRECYRYDICRKVCDNGN